MNNITEFMNKRVVFAEKQKGLPEAIRLIANSNTSSVIITDKGKPIGIVTERDIIKKLALSSKDFKKKRLDSVMTKGLFTVPIDFTLSQANEIMQKEKISHLPVTDKNKIIGIVTHSNISKRANAINWANKRFLHYQNIQTAIIIMFFIFLIAVILYKHFFL